MASSSTSTKAAPPKGRRFLWSVGSRVSFVLILSAGLAAFLVAGCRREKTANEKPLVVASFFPLYDFARRIGGTNFTLVCLVPPGGDPHCAEATPSSAKSVAQADLVLLLGLGMDGWVEKLAAGEHKTCLAIINEGLPVRRLGRAALAEFAKHAPDPVEVDPHVWLDPVLAQTLARRITDQLVKLAPA